MDDENEGLDLQREGLDPNTATGTRDRVDPGTGVYATGGTPMTTGDGVSASTMATGSNEGEAEYKEGDFKGATPRTKEYNKGVEGEVSAEVENGG